MNISTRARDAIGRNNAHIAQGMRASGVRHSQRTNEQGCCCLHSKHGRILPADQDGVGLLPGCRRRGHPHRNGPVDPWIHKSVAGNGR
jgi:hypothetical protein